MIRNKRIIAALLAAVMVFGMAGCASGGNTSTTDSEVSEEVTASEVESVEQVQETESTESEETTEEITEEQPIIEEGMLGFSGNGEVLLDRLFEEKGGNVVISDTSINLALSMLLEGANGNSQAQLEKYLGVTKEDAKEYSKKLVESFNSRDSEALKINVANSIWADENFTVKKEYVDLLAEYFKAESENIDFSAPDADDKVNAWVSEKTHGLINQIVDESDMQQLALILINTIYFKGTWAEEYAGAVEGEFNGNKLDVLKCTVDTYFENDKAVGFAKPYYGGFEFIGILPKAEGDFTLEELDIKGLLESRTEEYDVRTQVPKFEIEFGAELPEIIMALGVTDIFDGNADLSGIGDGLAVDNIIHKTYINLDEHGTEAAAVTAITAKNAMMPAEKEFKEVILDRDFVFIIYDRETETALFTGKIVDLK